MVLHGEYINNNDADLYEGTADQEIIADQVATNALHDAINVPDHRCPFSDDGRGIFIALLNETQVQNILPEGYGVAEHEWVNGIYPDCEAISIGRSRKEREIGLPPNLWWPRAVSWAQGIDLMSRLL